MITVTRIFYFDAAHMLSNYKGLCRNLHGHTYKLEIEIMKNGEFSLENPDMVIDFNELETRIKRLIINKLDHSTLLNTGQPEQKEICSMLKNYSLKFFSMDKETTAENILDEIIQILKFVFMPEHKLIRATLWETPKSYATYTER